MITFAHVLLLALVGFSLLPALVLLIVPLVFIWWIGRGLIAGGAEVDIDRLIDVLDDRWIAPKELADYMLRYWPALKYSSSATARQQTCTALAMIQIVVGLLVIWKASTIIGLIMLIEGGVLWAMATRVNRPLSMYRDDRVRNSRDAFCRTEWRNGVAALIAYAELYPENRNADFIAAHLLADDLVLSELSSMRR